MYIAIKNTFYKKIKSTCYSNITVKKFTLIYKVYEKVPTPVSALIHAATLVTAGVYLMVRLHIFWDDLIIFVGSLTALMAAIFGFYQNDLKRVIAFSTCSQLGYAFSISICWIALVFLIV